MLQNGEADREREVVTCKDAQLDLNCGHCRYVACTLTIRVPVSSRVFITLLVIVRVSVICDPQILFLYFVSECASLSNDLV